MSAASRSTARRPIGFSPGARRPHLPMACGRPSIITAGWRTSGGNVRQHRPLLIRSIVAAALAAAALSAAGVGASAADWPKSLHDIGSSGSTPDRAITAGTAASLKPAAGWPVRLGDRPITTQPILANGLIYVGAWDGYEYALRPDGTIAWRQYLGRTKNCFIADAVSSNPQQGTVAGVVSTGAVATASVNGHSRSVLYIGGGGHPGESGANNDGPPRPHPLAALPGENLWRRPPGGGPHPLILSPPPPYHHSAFVGVSSFHDW